MNRSFVFVILSIVILELNYAIPENDSNDVVYPEEEKRSIVQPFEVELRDEFTKLFAPDGNNKLKKKVEKKNPKRKESKKKKVKKPKNWKTTTKKPRSNNQKRKKRPNNSKQGSFRIIIENNIINIQPGQRFVIESHDDDYDEESIEEIEDNTRDCSSCGRGTHVNWKPFNPPLWPFK